MFVFFSRIKEEPTEETTKTMHITWPINSLYVRTQRKKYPDTDKLDVFFCRKIDIDSIPDLQNNVPASKIRQEARLQKVAVCNVLWLVRLSKWFKYNHTIHSSSSNNNNANVVQHRPPCCFQWNARILVYNRPFQSPSVAQRGQFHSIPRGDHRPRRYFPSAGK